jgi:hypothetical protein
MHLRTCVLAAGCWLLAAGRSNTYRSTRLHWLMSSQALP